jgi:hypothetical protein
MYKVETLSKKFDDMQSAFQAIHKILSRITDRLDEIDSLEESVISRLDRIEQKMCCRFMMEDNSEH